ncbi:hypothetical protein P7K49_040229 [Saguinus oedipus]|uniref:Clathrin/coatomer adaptor adaptin-like N-terminal domain-containing protein n=1 Tax=Saguinus oedipus TaxID=9490 RepID=A0ABQ9T8Q2_SAGOE|nr:hypothetical protein P7K49_040229 [Saguinus oedipus]
MGRGQVSAFGEAPGFPPESTVAPNLLVRACNQLGQFLQHRETNLRYLALESMCTLASSEFSHEAVKTHIETVINALKASPCPRGLLTPRAGAMGLPVKAGGRSASWLPAEMDVVLVLLASA